MFSGSDTHVRYTYLLEVSGQIINSYLFNNKIVLQVLQRLAVFYFFFLQSVADVLLGYLCEKNALLLIKKYIASHNSIVI